MDYSLPRSSILGLFQARVLEWVAISFSRGSSWPRDGTQISRIVGRCFTVWATGKVLSYWEVQWKCYSKPLSYVWLMQDWLDSSMRIASANINRRELGLACGSVHVPAVSWPTSPASSSQPNPTSSSTHYFISSHCIFAAAAFFFTFASYKMLTHATFLFLFTLYLFLTHLEPFWS